MRPTLGLVLFLLLAALCPAATPARAYNEAPALNQMVDVAIALWGMAAPWPVFMHDETAMPAGFPPVAYAALPADHSRCDIHVVSQIFAGTDPVLIQGVINHEYGHCLGLGHIEQEGLMNARGLGAFSGWDRLEFWRHWPAPYRLFVAY